MSLNTYFERAKPLRNRSRRLTGSTFSKFGVLGPNSLIFSKTARRGACEENSCRSRSTACVAAVCKPHSIYLDGVEPLPNRSRRLTGSISSKFRSLLFYCGGFVLCWGSYIAYFVLTVFCKGVNTFEQCFAKVLIFCNSVLQRC